MAQIVLATEKSVRQGIEAGDIISIHDDDVKLSGAGYENFKVVRVEGYTAEQVKAAIEAKMPKRGTAFYLSVGAKWTLESPQEKQVWQDSKGVWYFIEKDPKFQLTAKGWTADDETVLSSELTELTQKTSILDKIEPKIHLASENFVEAKDLNA